MPNNTVLPWLSSYGAKHPLEDTQTPSLISPSCDPLAYGEFVGLMAKEEQMGLEANYANMHADPGSGLHPLKSSFASPSRSRNVSVLPLGV